jgi:glutamine amidotransferase PdxT
MSRAPRHVVLAFLGVVASLCLAACGVSSSQTGKPPAAADILLFVGSGTWPGDVAAVEQVLRDNHFNYSTANSPQLNAMSESQLHAFRLLIVPGGNFEKIGNNLSPGATANIRSAVRGGLNYLGLCAGAFFAGNSPYNGLDLTGGVRFNFYALEAQGTRKSAVPISVAGASTNDHYWEDGPELSGWGDVVAKYADGTPAVVEGSVQNGWVILTGIHPEAPESWRRGMVFATPASEDNAYAAVLIDAALNATRLSHY